MDAKPGHHKNARKREQGGDSVRYGIGNFFAFGLVVEAKFTGFFGFRAFVITLWLSPLKMSVSTFILYKICPVL